jgi:hypothetical protein
MVAQGLEGICSVVNDGLEKIDENDPRLVALREWLRDTSAT